MTNRAEMIQLLKLITGANTSAKFNEESIKSWCLVFGSQPRLKLYKAVAEYIKNGSKFTPTISEINEIMQRQKLRGEYAPPNDQRDERCFWWMVINGVGDPNEIPERVIREIYADP